MLVAFWDNSSVRENPPLVSPTAFALYLTYVTGTVKNGSPFLGENGKLVNESNTDLILGTLYLFWLTSVIKLVDFKSSDLTDNYLPRLPANHRSHNMFYYIGEGCRKRLFWRIYRSNFKYINLQVLVSLILPVFFYAIPFFLKNYYWLFKKLHLGVKMKNYLLVGYCIDWGWQSLLSLKTL